MVPKSIEDSDLVAISNFRQAGRFPVLAYRHEGTVRQNLKPNICIVKFNFQQFVLEAQHC